MSKYRSASDSLRPGQLNRLVATIKDRVPAKRVVCAQCGKEKDAEGFFRVKRDEVEQPCKKCWHEAARPDPNI